MTLTITNDLDLLVYSKSYRCIHWTAGNCLLLNKTLNKNKLSSNCALYICLLRTTIISYQELFFYFQSKSLRKLIQQHFRLYAQLSESECVYRFFDTLSTVNKFKQERFKCALGVSKLFSSPEHETFILKLW